MRIVSLLLVAVLALGGCGDGSDQGTPQESGGGAGAAGSGAGGEAGGAAGEAGAAGQDAQAPDAEPDAPADASHPPCTLPLAFTDEEKQLISSGDESTKMEIVTNQTPAGDAFLRQVACPLDTTDPMVKLLIGRMRATLASTNGGVGIAGPQVGVSRRLFLAERAELQGSPVVAYLNPTIVSYSPEQANGLEGCLSIPGKQGPVMRSLIVVVDYVAEDGTTVTGESIGSLTNNMEKFSARIMQHEYDHLDGILYIDY